MNATQLLTLSGLVYFWDFFLLLLIFWRVDTDTLENYCIASMFINLITATVILIALRVI